MNKIITCSLFTLTIFVFCYKKFDDAYKPPEPKCIVTSSFNIERVFLEGNGFKVAYFSGESKQLIFEYYLGNIICDVPDDNPIWIDQKSIIYENGYAERTGVIHIHNPKELDVNSYQYYQNKAWHPVNAKAIE